MQNRDLSLAGRPFLSGLGKQVAVLERPVSQLTEGGARPTGSKDPSALPINKVYSWMSWDADHFPAEPSDEIVALEST